jgi:aryl-alcohol dehydrogenase-like predicted oxidoreductase
MKIDPSSGQQVMESMPEEIKQTAGNSLKWLLVDAIDILYQHHVDPKIPMEDLVTAVNGIIQEDKVKNFGLCGTALKTIRVHMQSERSSCPKQIIWSILWLI